MRLRLVPALLALPFVAACSSSGGSPALAEASVGPDGGVLEVTEGTYAGLRIEIPAGALTAATRIVARSGSASAHPGFRPLGRGVVLEPAGVEFRIPVQLTLPYDAGSQSTNQLSFLARDAAGDVVQLAPATGDPENPIATLSTTTFAPAGTASTLWVAERYFSGFIVDDYLPFEDGNTYAFESGLTVDLTATTTAPNLEGLELFELTFGSADADFGVWLQEDNFGDNRMLGAFQTVGDDFQRVHEPTLFFPFFVTLDQPIRSSYAFTGYTPFGATEPSFSGTAVADIFITKPAGAVITPAGEFTDLVRFEIVTRVSRDFGAAREERLVMTLARDVGPVAIEAFGVRAGLVRAVVGGEEIPPPPGGGGM